MSIAVKALALRHMIQQPSVWQTAVLLFVIVGASIVVAYTVHKSRGYLAELQVLQNERDRLEIEWGQLLLEQQTWGAYGRVGKVATDELGMRPPAPQDVIMVRP